MKKLLSLYFSKNVIDQEGRNGETMLNKETGKILIS